MDLHVIKSYVKETLFSSIRYLPRPRILYFISFLSFPVSFPYKSIVLFLYVNRPEFLVRKLINLFVVACSDSDDSTPKVKEESFLNDVNFQLCSKVN